jgi:hypothetical protein
VVQEEHSVQLAPPPLTVAVTSFVVEIPKIQMVLACVGIIVPVKPAQEEVLLAQ